MNTPQQFLLLLLMLLPCSTLHAKSIGLSAGFENQQQNYLSDVSTLQEPYVGVTLDLQHWRVRTHGWLSRGPKLSIVQSAQSLRASADLPIYQFNEQHGLWFASQYRQTQFTTITDASHIFLGNNGQTTTITANDQILSQHQQQAYQLYWYESSILIGAINQIGLIYQHETSPAASGISNTNADWFDGVWSGWGILLGRVRDYKGLNFQWHATLTQLNSEFSNNITNNVVLSKTESQVYGLTFKASWHYRYYLAPYWYLVPRLGFSSGIIFQKEFDPQQVEHDPYRQTEWFSEIQLQKRF